MTDDHDPSVQFNVAWAREFIQEALRRMERECAQSNRADIWTIFRGRVLRPAFEGQAPVEYVELVNQLGLATPLAACQLLTTAKRMFGRSLQSVALEYAGEAGDAQEEIQDLRQAVAKAASNAPRPS